MCVYRIQQKSRQRFTTFKWYLQYKTKEDYVTTYKVSKYKTKIEKELQLINCNYSIKQKQTKIYNLQIVSIV